MDDKNKADNVSSEAHTEAVAEGKIELATAENSANIQPQATDNDPKVTSAYDQEEGLVFDWRQTVEGEIEPTVTEADPTPSSTEKVQATPTNEPPEEAKIQAKKNKASTESSPSPEASTSFFGNVFRWGGRTTPAPKKHNENELLRDEDGVEWKDAPCFEGSERWFWRIGYRLDNSKAPIGVVFDTVPPHNELTDDAQEFLKEVETASVRVSIAFQDYHPERKLMFRSLKDAAKTGLCGERPDLALAGVYMGSFKNLVPPMSEKVRASFLKNTMKWNGFISAISLLVFIFALAIHSSVFDDLQTKVIACPEGESATAPYCGKAQVSLGLATARFFYPDLQFTEVGPPEAKEVAISENLNMYSNLVMGYALAIIGGSIGLVFTAFLRNRVITYDSFDAIYQYGMSPGRYLSFIMILALVVTVLLAFQLITIGVGGINLSDVANTPQYGLLIGLICSISEPVISGMVVNRFKAAEHSATTNIKATAGA